MSVAAAVASTPVPTPSPSPSVAPVVHAVTTVVAHPATLSAWNSLASQISTPDLVVFAGVVASALQTQVNRLPWLQHDIAKVQDLRRFLVSVALPVAGVGLAGLANGHNSLGLAPVVYVVSQATFYVVKILRGDSIVVPVQDPAPAVAEG